MDSIISKTVLTFSEAVAYTGYTRSYLQKLTSGRLIPHSKPNGKNIFFDRRELEQWLMRNPRKSLRQIQTEAANHISTH